MFSVAQGAHRGRPVAAALCTPGLWPPKSPLRGTFDLSRQASGRAEAASVQNTALSPHPCGLPRPSENVSAILRPPTPAVSASVVKTLKAGRTDRRYCYRLATFLRGFPGRGALRLLRATFQWCYVAPVSAAPPGDAIVSGHNTQKQKAQSSD